MEKTLPFLVPHRAGNACEYCRLPAAETDLTFPIDHIMARQHGGTSTEDNLALACPSCNLHKGPNISGTDPETGLLTPLFNPRRQRWRDHFRWNGVLIVPTSAVGRVTLYVLQMNNPMQVAVRKETLASGWLLRLEM